MTQDEVDALIEKLVALSSQYSMLIPTIIHMYGPGSPMLAAAWQVTFKIDKLRELIEESRHEQHSDEDTTPRRWDGSTGRR